jgi:hypothetical protein
MSIATSTPTVHPVRREPLVLALALVALVVAHLVDGLLAARLAWRRGRGHRGGQ